MGSPFAYVLNAPVKHSNGEFLNCLRRLTPQKRQRRNSTKQAENFVLRIRNWRRSEKSFLVCYTFVFAFHFRFVINLHFMHHFCHWNERVNFTHRIYMCERFAPFFLFFPNIIVIILCSVPFEMRTHFFWWR